MPRDLFAEYGVETEAPRDLFAEYGVPASAPVPAPAPKPTGTTAWQARLAALGHGATSAYRGIRELAAKAAQKIPLLAGDEEKAKANLAALRTDEAAYQSLKSKESPEIQKIMSRWEMGGEFVDPVTFAAMPVLGIAKAATPALRVAKNVGIRAVEGALGAAEAGALRSTGKDTLSEDLAARGTAALESAPMGAVLGGGLGLIGGLYGNKVRSNKLNKIRATRAAQAVEREGQAAYSAAIDDLVAKANLGDEVAIRSTPAERSAQTFLNPAELEAAGALRIAQEQAARQRFPQSVVDQMGPGGEVSPYQRAAQAEAPWILGETDYTVSPDARPTPPGPMPDMPVGEVPPPMDVSPHPPGTPIGIDATEASAALVGELPPRPPPAAWDFSRESGAATKPVLQGLARAAGGGVAGAAIPADTPEERLRNAALGAAGAVAAPSLYRALAGRLKGKAPEEVVPALDRRIAEYVKASKAGTLPEPPPVPVAAYGKSTGELPKYASSINLNRMGADEVEKRTLLETTDLLSNMIDKARGGKMTFDQIREASTRLDDMIRPLPVPKKGMILDAVNADRVRNAQVASTQDFHAMMEQYKVNPEGLSDEFLGEFRKSFERHAYLTMLDAKTATATGRALAARRMISSPTKNYSEMLNAMGGKSFNRDLLNQMSKIDTSDLGQVNAFIKSFAKVKTSDMLYEGWVNFLLSGPTTHVANTFSNAMTFLTKPLESGLAAGSEAVLSKLQGRHRERFFGEALQDVWGGIEGVKDGARTAMRLLMDESIPADRLMKIEELARTQSIPGKTGYWIRSPGRALMAADAFFKSVNYSAEVRGLAYRKASEAGLRGQARIDKMAEILSDLTSHPDMVASAKNEAVYRTFNKEFGPAGRAINKLRTTPYIGWPAKVLIPFLRTPMNIAKFSLERTPLNLPRLAYKAAKGTLKGAELADEMAKPILGAALSLPVVLGVLEGNITGQGPKEQSKRDALLRTGWQPYSVKIGDTYVPFARLEPLSSILGMTADFVELSKTASDTDAAKIAERVASSFAKNITSKTFMQGLSSFVDFLSDPGGSGERFVEGLAGSVIPTGVASVARAVDPVQREVHGPLDAIKSRIPGVSQSLAPQIELWGNEKQRPGNALERLVSPMPTSKASKDWVDNELARIGATVGRAKRSIGGVDLTPREYADYVGRSSSQAYPEVVSILNSSASDEDKADKVQAAFSKHRAKVAKEIIPPSMRTK
jgi:hypothetical protein